MRSLNLLVLVILFPDESIYCKVVASMETYTSVETNRHGKHNCWIDYNAVKVEDENVENYQRTCRAHFTW
ncbi:hypothetical protein ACHQM5_003015 [Ranunculus cassubicifolius]